MPNDMSPFAQTILNERYAHTKSDGQKETWREVAERVVTNVMGSVPHPTAKQLIPDLIEIITQRKFMPGGRYLYACGRSFHQTQNCLLLRPEDSREGWGDHMYKSMTALMTGAGIGAVYSDLRASGVPLKRTGGYSSGPLALMEMTNEVARGARQGGNRRAALWAGLHWNHPDVLEFIRMKDWQKEVRDLKAADYNFPARMDFTNISVILDDAFFKAYYGGDTLARQIYWTVVSRMMTTGEPGFSVDVGENEGENLRNACTEVTSREDSDICNLGSINLARIEGIGEMRVVTELATAFLLAGSVYSDVPYEKVFQVRQRNRRLGLGLLGVHERLLVAGSSVNDPSTLDPLLKEYAESGTYAKRWADLWSLSTPIKTRAIAPTGTIGILAETTTGAEPVFCAAYKRRYFDHGNWRYQYVRDPTAERLIAAGIGSEDIEDAYTLAVNPVLRFRFQAALQKYVDHAISSTVNLPHWGSPFNNFNRIDDFGTSLMEVLPSLRGITVYPDGARGGQPIVPVEWAETEGAIGEVFTESGDVCSISKGESCGA